MEVDVCNRDEVVTALTEISTHGAALLKVKTQLFDVHLLSFLQAFGILKHAKVGFIQLVDKLGGASPWHILKL